jgi:hypothetical protein
MSDWIASQRHWLSIEPLPGYASEVNPIEQECRSRSGFPSGEVPDDWCRSHLQPCRPIWTRGARPRKGNGTLKGERARRCFVRGSFWQLCCSLWQCALLMVVRANYCGSTQQ